MTSYHALSDAEAISRQLGGEKRGANDWRLPHLCGGGRPGDPLGDNPGLSISDSPDGLIVKCWYGCENSEAYAAVREGLGLYQDSSQEPVSAPNGASVYGKATIDSILAGRCPCCRANEFRTALPEWATSEDDFAPYLLLVCASCRMSYDALHGALVDIVGDRGQAWLQRAPYTLADGKKRYRLRRDPGQGPKGQWDQAGKARRTSGREPLRWQDGTPVVLVEGDKAAAALLSAELPHGIYSVGDTSGLGSANYSTLTGQTVIIWPDRDKINEKTGKRPGEVAAHKAAASLLRLDCEVLTVEVDNLPDKTDAADFTRSEILAMLDAASVYQSLENAEPSQKSDQIPPSDYSWYVKGDFVRIWECTPVGDIARTLRECAGDLLAVRMDSGESAQLRVDNGHGVWRPDEDELHRRIAATALKWHHASVDANISRKQAQEVASWAKQAATPVSWARAIASTGRVVAGWRNREGPMPGLLTRAWDIEMDTNGRYLGCANGVVDLQDGRLLPQHEGRKHLVSRSTGVAYDPDAKHWAVDALLSHLPDDVREYLLASLGRAVWAQPDKSFLVLCGPKNGGKTTLTLAVQASLGDESDTLSEDALRPTRGGKIGPTPERRALVECRIASAVEVENWRIDYGRLKAFAGGGDWISYQPKYGAESKRKVRATILMAANEMPTLGLTDPAVHDRFRLIDYPQPFERNPAIKLAFEKDPAAAAAMLALLVRYASKNPPGRDLPIPASVQRAIDTAADVEAGDFGAWLVTAIREDMHPERGRLTGNQVWEAWAEYRGSDASTGEVGGISRRDVPRLVKRRFSLGNVVSMRIDGTMVKGWRGVRLATQAEREAAEAEMLEQVDALALMICRQCGEDVSGGHLGAAASLDADGVCRLCSTHGLVPKISEVAETPPAEVRRQAEDTVLEQAISTLEEARRLPPPLLPGQLTMADMSGLELSSKVNGAAGMLEVREDEDADLDDVA